MTTLTTDPVDHWVNLHQQTIRKPLLNEMHQTAEEALAESDPMRKAFLTGMHTGYAVGFGLVTREALTRARRTPGSANVHIDFRKPRGFDDEDTLWACGVRHGYYLGTSERLDATACDMCGERIVDALDEVESCEHGAFCDGEGCIQYFHSGGGLDMCRFADALADGDL
jgi:hypothetical protein